MKTQVEQIKAAKRAYIMLVNNPKDGMSASRFSIYLDAGNGLEVLWPMQESDKKKLLPNQTLSTVRTYPAYHFIFKGCGYSKTDELGQILKHINPTVEVFTINGHSPSNC